MKPTDYGTQRILDILANNNAHSVKEYVIYVLWECSTEFMVGNGMPTDPEVEKWIEVLQARDDSSCKDILTAICACREYINPTPTPMPPYSGQSDHVVSVKTIKLKLK